MIGARAFQFGKLPVLLLACRVESHLDQQTQPHQSGEFLLVRTANRSARMTCLASGIESREVSRSKLLPTIVSDLARDVEHHGINDRFDALDSSMGGGEG